MIKISVSFINTFREYLYNIRNYQGEDKFTTEDIIDMIKGDYKHSKYAELGTAYHKVLESPDTTYNKEHNIFETDGIVFTPENIMPALEIIDYRFPFEVAIEKEYKIEGHNVLLKGRVDQLVGSRVVENKTCWGLYDYDKYAMSCQWGFYLEMFELKTIQFNVFEMREKSGEYQLVDIHRFKEYINDDIKRRNLDVLTELVRFIYSNELESYFQIKKKVENKMKINKIHISNVLGISEFSFEAGQFNSIEGKNGSGKSSFLEAIKLAIKGSKDATIIKNGNKKGEVVLIFDEGTHLKRTFNGSKSKLELYSQRGEAIKKPQSVLNDLTDVLSTNPIEFITAKAKERTQLMLDAVPIKVNESDLKEMLNGSFELANIQNFENHGLQILDIAHSNIYNERTIVNRQMKEKQSTINGINIESIPLDIPLDDLKKEKSELDLKIDESRMKKDDYLQSLMNKEAEEVELIRAKFNQQKQNLNDKFNQSLVERQELKANLQSKLDNYSQYESMKTIVNQNKKQLESLKNNSENLSNDLVKLEKYKTSLLKELPIKGLEVRDSEIYFDNVPFDRLNTASKIDIAIEIAKIRVGDLKLICVDGLEVFDAETLTAFKVKSEESNLQMFVTRVTNNDFEVINN